MRSKILLGIVLFLMSSCMKGLIFDKDMVIGDWKMWEVYSPGYLYYWTFTDDSVYIYKQADSTFTGTVTQSDESGSSDYSKVLVYQQAGWNNHSFDLNLFAQTNPFDPERNLNCHIEISKYKRGYLVLAADNYSWTATLSRIRQ